MSIASEDIDELAVAQSLLRCGANVFLKHNNAPGYLTKNSQWDGEYHLAYVEESYDESTNKCKIIWRRNGFSDIVDFILTSPDQVKAAIDYKTLLSIQVEDDNNGQIHNAKIVDLLDGSLGSSYNTPGQVQIKWETGQRVLICLSQVQVTINTGRRKRRRVSPPKESAHQIVAQKKKKKKPVPKKQPKFKKQEIITIDSSDSSSEEDDESDKKRPWVDKTPKDKNSYDDNQSALFGDSESEDEESIQKRGKRAIRLSRGTDPPRNTNIKTKRSAHDDERSSSSGNISLGTQEDVLKHSEAASSTLLGSKLKARQGKNTSEGSQSSQAQSSESSQEESGSRKQRTITPKKLQLYTKRNEVLLHGFVQSIEEKEPHQAIRIVQKVLGNAATCKKGSSELHESLIDANMMLQESLYNINDRTHFVKAPPQTNIDTSGSQEVDKNKGHIIRLAKKFGLSPPQIGNVLDHAAPKESDGDGGGYFSIDKAIEKTMELKDSGNSDYSESDPKEDNVAATMQPPEGATILGSRIKTVFENGKEYEGTITDVHYRVAYDDGDIETMNPAEVFEKLACNGSVLDTGNDFKCKALELFSGCSLLSTLCRRKGMDTISVDNDINSNASVKADFTSSYVQSLIGSQTFDFIHASPVCRTYSRLAGGVHRTKDNYNKSSDSHSADAMLLQLYFFIVEALKKSSDTTVTIENPSTGYMKHSKIISLLETEHGFKRYDIFYCQFGRAEQKPTSIWTNDEALGRVLIKIGGKCKCIGRHEEGVKVNNDKNFSALPIKLCQIISDYVQSKHQSLKFKRFASKCNEEETDEQV